MIVMHPLPRVNELHASAVDLLNMQNTSNKHSMGFQQGWLYSVEAWV